MYVQKDTLDGLLRHVFETLLAEEELVTAGRGDFKEVFGGCLHLTNPLARLSRTESKGKVYSALGEFLWYLSKGTCLDFIDYYVPGRFQEESDDQITVRSGYGERLQAWRGLNQLHNVVQLLQKHRTSRRATIQLFDATDIAERYASIPCTCTLQFLVRNNRLHMFVAMRSNDAYLGLPHDIFSFTLLQEMIARTIGAELGEYKHCAGSLHLYQKHFEAAEQYLWEGWQDPIHMPAMPVGDPHDGIEWLRGVEESARLKRGEDLDAAIRTAKVDDYWKDLGRLLLSYRASRDSNATLIAGLKDQLHSDVYKMFLVAKLDVAEDRKNGAGANR
ncbi:MAG: thymidylate synthase [Burkholderiaceae bacterium]